MLLCHVFLVRMVLSSDHPGTHLQVNCNYLSVTNHVDIEQLKKSTEIISIVVHINFIWPPDQEFILP